MTSPITQASFIGGELAPTLQSRVDLPRYAQAAKLIKNFVVGQHGGIANRPGTEVFGRGRLQDGSLVRWIKFAPAADEQYMLELGDHYLKIWRGTEAVLTEPFPIVAGHTALSGTLNSTPLSMKPGYGSPGLWIAQKLVPDSVGHTFTVSRIAFELARSADPDVATLEVALYTDAGGGPGVPIAGFDFADFTDVPGASLPAEPDGAVVTFELRAPPAIPTVLPYDPYWVVLRSQDDTARSGVASVFRTFDDKYAAGAFKRSYDGLFWDFGGTLGIDLGFQLRSTVPAVEVVLATPWSAEQVALLTYTQSVDVMTLCDPTHGASAMELKSFSPSVWTLDTIPEFDNIGEPTAVTAPSIPSVSPFRTWQYAASGVPFGDGHESLPFISAVFNVGSDISASLPLHLVITPGTTVEYYNVYKGLGATFGFVGRTGLPVSASAIYTVAYNEAYADRFAFYLAAGYPTRQAQHLATLDAVAAGQAALAAIPGGVPSIFDFYDENFAPDYTDPPPSAFNPFTALGGLKPACVTYFQQRQVFANWQGKPDTFSMSASADYRRFQPAIPATADDPIEATLASGQLDEIRALVPLRDLLMFTASANFVVNGAKGVIAPDDIDAAPYSRRGCSFQPQPVIVGNVVLFYDNSGHVREWVFDQNTNNFPASDLDLLASHLFRHRTIVSWAYTDAPQPVLWVVLDDGTFLTLTYHRDQSVAAWARHDTQGRVRWITQAREGRDDCLYLVVDRDGFGPAADETRTFLERMLARDAVTSRFLDCAITRTDPQVGVFVIGSAEGEAGHAAGDVTVLGIEVPVSGAPIAPGDWVVVTAPGGDYRFQIASVYVPNVYNAQCLDPVPQSDTGMILMQWSFLRAIWTGFDELAGKTAGVVADGDPHPDIVVAQDGTITLERHCAEVTCGLKYVSELRTLRVSQLPTRQKAIAKVYLDVLESRGLEVAQAREDGTDEVFIPVKQSDLALPVTQTARLEIDIDSTWNKGAALVVRQRQPLPAEITGIAPEVQVAG